MKTLYISTLTFLLLIISLVSFAQNGTIKGKVFNSINNDPLPFVNVVIQGTTVGASSDVNGNYEISNLKPGLYNLEASFVGFVKKSVLEVEVLNSKPTFVDFALNQTATKLNDVEIKSSPFTKKEESPVSLRTIGVSELARNPGGNSDISKVLQSLPGVTPTVAFRNDIIIRGGSPNENRFYLDDIEVPNINHFATQGSSGGPVGLINVDFIREVDFYSSAFPANRNNTLSSVMDFKFKDGRSDKLGGRFVIGASDIGLTLEGPLNKNATFLASARRSYLGTLFKALGLPFLPTYNDFQVKYKWKPTPKNEIEFLGLGAIDDFVLNLGLQETGTQAQKYLLGYLPVSSQWNYMNGLKYAHYDKASYTTLVLSRNMLNNRSYKYQDNIEIPENKIQDYSSQEIENKFRAENTSRRMGFKINYGLSAEYDEYNNSTYNKISTPFGVDTIQFSSKLELVKYGIFGQISKAFFEDRLSLSFGIRTDGSSFDKSTSDLSKQISPRFSLSFSITPELSFNVNTGIYYQLPAYTILGYRNFSGELVNKSNNVSFIESKHVVAGFEYLTKSNLKLSLEGFMKLYDNYPFSVKDSVCLANMGSDFGIIGNEAVLSTAKGKSYGIEFLAQQKLFKGIYALFTYTYVRSEFEDKHGNLVPSAWDTRHIFNLTGGKTFKRNWELGLKFRYSLGSPYTPYNMDESSLISNWNVTHQGIVDYNQLNTKRLQPFQQLDIRVDKKYYLKKFKLNFYIDLANAYNYQYELPPILDVVRDSNGNPVVNPSDPTRYQLETYKNLTGTLLPSIGIIIEF
ncbi:MAG: TonB-dependent receptor [Bacteroidetes bacterium]|nr:TonB-dependent receptor [Bacteroidota bacterium]